MKKINYYIYQPQELAAGITGFYDTITIEVESGNPGGDEAGEYSFQEFMMQSLKEWYDGALVSLKPFS